LDSRGGDSQNRTRANAIILSILKILKEKKIPVVGGDVYKIIDGHIQITYDNWFINNDGTSEFVERSLNKAISYIGEYERINGDNFVYTLALSNNNGPGAG